MPIPGFPGPTNPFQTVSSTELVQMINALRARVQQLEQALTIAGPTVALKTGSASIVLKPDGTIEIKGKNITIEGSGQVRVKATGELTLKGSKVTEN